MCCAVRSVEECVVVSRTLYHICVRMDGVLGKSEEGLNELREWHWMHKSIATEALITTNICESHMKLKVD